MIGYFFIHESLKTIILKIADGYEEKTIEIKTGPFKTGSLSNIYLYILSSYLIPALLVFVSGLQLFFIVTMRIQLLHTHLQLVLLAYWLSLTRRTITVLSHIPVD